MPRTTLLSLVSDYYVVCSARLAELNKKQGQDKTNEPLDVKCNTVILVFYYTFSFIFRYLFFQNI